MELQEDRMQVKEVREGMCLFSSVVNCILYADKGKIG